MQQQLEEMSITEASPRPSCPKHRDPSSHTNIASVLQMSFSGEPPKFTADFPEAVFREGADELTLRREEKGMFRTFIDTPNVGDRTWRHRSMRTGNLPGHL